MNRCAEFGDAIGEMLVESGPFIYAKVNMIIMQIIILLEAANLAFACLRCMDFAKENKDLFEVTLGVNKIGTSK